PQAESAAAQIRPYDIEAEKGKMLVVVYDRENGSRSARELAEQESIWSGGGEASSVSQARIPALRGRPLHRKRHPLRRHGSHAKRVVFHSDPDATRSVQSF